ncbi:TPA: peptidylprolyl isomerase [Candidatus Berkelbacteria bacterium]|uniref:Peptidyl-prolyl cis-trans isomerase n=1 Tax=Berkelbacteria bacterium GW2011_GWE1_39_12 TaxID=1618337 RepID=A0A0G4B4H6_9BACT|nr:MAG: peptidyl-prolyl cis-trans isomerase A, peptidyl-prolyl cis-trans isomerase B (cyclophilin B) [Berkelbacteria bacterium GW2011_GWE1_39_12]HBO60390.1 peptidylprolyl isomerase [Candidatus Berkelbacteria bacterium]
MYKKLFLLPLIIGFLFLFSGCDSQVSDEPINGTSKDPIMNLSFPGILSKDKIENKKAVITTNKGVIEFELFADKSPKTVSNFVYLANSKFYDGLTFHRVEPGFVIQGGDPNGNGTGGPGYKFEDETVQGDYELGSVAMANSGPDTNGSQFFICLDNLPSLPKQYSLFGKVTSGIDVVKQIAVGDKIEKIEIKDK